LVISELQKKEQLQTPENMKQEKNGIFLPKKQRAEYSFKYTSFNTIEQIIINTSIKNSKTSPPCNSTVILQKVRKIFAGLDLWNPIS